MVILQGNVVDLKTENNNWVESFTSYVNAIFYDLV
jgi:hypothetical protein